MWRNLLASFCYVFCWLLLSNRTISRKFILFILRLLRHFSHVGVTLSQLYGEMASAKEFPRSCEPSYEMFENVWNNEKKSSTRQRRWRTPQSAENVFLLIKYEKTPTKRHIRLTRAFYPLSDLRLLKCHKCRKKSSYSCLVCVVVLCARDSLFAHF